MSNPRTLLLVISIGLAWSSVPATAQPLGAFRWQLLPYCNVLTLNIILQNGVYTLDGTDDRCGAAQAASAGGLAFLNPNGTVGFGVTMVQPGGTPVHLEATISMASLGGSWRDSSGASGNFVFLLGAGLGGPPRQVPTGGLPPGAVTSLQLASGAVGVAAMAANAITGANVINGSLTQADIGDAPRLLSVEGDTHVPLPSDVNTVVVQITFNAPAAGRVLVNTSGSLTFTGSMTLDSIDCGLTTGAVSTSPYAAIAIELNAGNLFQVPFGGTRTFSVAAGSSTTFKLICYAHGSNTTVTTPVMTALFVAGS